MRWRTRTEYHLSRWGVAGVFLVAVGPFSAWFAYKSMVEEITSFRPDEGTIASMELAVLGSVAAVLLGLVMVIVGRVAVTEMVDRREPDFYMLESEQREHRDLTRQGVYDAKLQTDEEEDAAARKQPR